MQFSVMVDHVQAMFNNRSDITDTIAKQKINAVYQRLALAFRFYELEQTSTATTTVSGTASYAVPSGCRETISIIDTTNHYKLEPMDIEWYEGQYVGTGFTGRPEYYVRYGSNYLLWPTPDGAYALQIRYTKLPAELSADGDVPVYPDEWHPVIEYLAAADIAFMIGQDTRAMNFKNEGLGIISTIQEDKTQDKRHGHVQIEVERTRPSGASRRTGYAEYP